MKMKEILLPALLLLTLSSCVEDKNKLEGNWVTVEKPWNTREILMFNEGGGLTLRKETELSGKYRLDGNKLISITANPMNNLEIIDTADVVLTEDSLFMTRKLHGEPKTTKLSRISGDVDEITGNWKWFDDLGREGTITYKDDGTLYALLVVDEKTGVYKAENDSLTLSFQGTTYRGLPYRLNNDTLFILSPDGKKEIPHVPFNE